MASVVEICNSALTQKLGASSITALSDVSKEAKAATRSYPRTRDFLLRMHPWNFNKTRTILAPLTSTPAHTYDYEYQLPGDFARMNQVDTDYDWVVEGKKILTNEGDSLWIVYHTLEEDVSQYDPIFIEVLTTRMAYDMCEELTQSASKKRELDTDFKQLLLNARLVDAMEGSASTFKEDSWVLSRF